jgi:hypothetical protein
MAATALVTAILALEAKLLPSEITLVTTLVKKIHNHKRPAVAIKAATKAVAATPQDGPTPGGTNDPASEFFDE